MNKDELSLVIKTIAHNNFTIITAPTGTGKSTQIPLEILQQGISVITTESRILAAKSLAEWVSKLNKSKLGNEIGYNTGMGSDYIYNKTECLYRTDGTELHFRFLQNSEFQVLIIDEIHEWNHNQELLVALAKEFVQVNPQLHVVIMSATIDANPLSKFLENAPIVELKGHFFKITENKPHTSSIAKEANLYAKQGKNILVFVDGKGSILRCIEELKSLKSNSEIIPLHAEQTYEEQQKAFQISSIPKIVVATDVAQSAITIADIDVVITNGVKRVIRVVEGKVGLYFERISVFDELQQKGRCGRTKDGIFVNMYTGDEIQNKEPTPQIIITPIDQQALLLASIGRNIRDIDYFHKPPTELIDQAFELLYSLDAIDKSEQITHTGSIMAQFSAKSEQARMIVAGHDLGVLNDVIKIIAILETKGIYDSSNRKWKHGINNTSSDLIGQLELFNRALTMKTDTSLRTTGVHVQKFHKAVEIYEKLWKQVNLVYPNTKRSEVSCNRSKVIQACATGLKQHIYKAQNGKLWGDNNIRKISRDSTMAQGYSGWIVGIPFDLEIKTDTGNKILHLLTFGTQVNGRLLAKIGATKQDSITIYRYLADQDTIIVSNGNNERIITWDALLISTTSDELARIHSQIINQQFNFATDNLSGILKSFTLGYGSKQIGKQLSPEPYGKDPKTKEVLYAYPAYIFKFGKTHIKFFQTSQERDDAIKKSMERIKNVA